MNAFYTYLHKKPGGAVFYVGKGMGDRAYSHDNRNIHWRRTVAKYGLEVQIMSYWDTEQEAFEQEKLLIKSFRDSGIKLVNLTNGGEGSSGYKWNDEQKERWRAANAQNGMLGKKHSDSAKAKMSLKSAGHKTSEATRAKISEKMKVRVFSETHRKNLSVATTGGNNPTARPCVVNGISFDCAQAAATAMGVCKSTVARKCKRGDNPLFQYV
jgi:group I intron endonuclease